MRDAFGYSLLFHAAIMVIGYYGVPYFVRPPTLVDAPIMVEIVNVDEMTNVPPPAPKPEKKPPPETKKKAPPPPKPPKQATPPPPPEPEVAALPPELKPEAKPKPKPKPKAKPKPEAKPKPLFAKLKPRRKPKPPDAFTSVLKTVEKLKARPRPEKKPDEKKPEKKTKQPETFAQQVAKALSARSAKHDPLRPLSVTVIDRLRQQIAKCWSLQSGAREAENLIIQIRVAMNPDGTPRDARIENKAQMADPYFRSAAESALRAVLNPRCHPFKLPRENYDQWRDLVLVFDPRYMF